MRVTGALIIALLTCNSFYYIVAGRTSEALDSSAWYVLLILFTLESARRVRGARMLELVRGARLVAAVAVGAAAAGYVMERAWLDATNIFLWIAVVALLEIEVRHPAAVERRRMLFTRAAIVLYSALAALVVIWLVRGSWMNAWDATLWLAAFGMLELNVLRTTPIEKSI